MSLLRSCRFTTLHLITDGAFAPFSFSEKNLCIYGKYDIIWGMKGYETILTKLDESVQTRRNLHTHACNFLLSFFLIMGTSPAFSEIDISEQIKYKEELVNELKDEIQQIDSEMLRCEKVKKGWKTATVVGSIGVVATGTAAIVQTVNANKKQQTENKTEEK